MVLFSPAGFSGTARSCSVIFFPGRSTGAEVRINQLQGWPPSRFQAAEARGLYAPPSPESLQLQAASLIPSVSPQDSPEVFLLWKDPDSESVCSTRFKVADAGVAIRMVRALTSCRDRSLEEIGKVEVREETETFPGLKKILMP